MSMNGSHAVKKTEQRRKRLKRLVGAAMVAVLLAVVVAYRWKPRRGEKQPPSPAAVPANVNQQLSGYTFTRSDNGRRIFTVHAARTVAYKQNGTTLLENVVVEVFGHEGHRHDLMRTAECDYFPPSGKLFAPGKAEIELNAPAGVSEPETAAARASVPAGSVRPTFLETSQVSLDRAGMMVASDRLVRFRVGPLSGTARGLTYAARDGWLELKRDVAADLAIQGARVPLHLTAARLRYDKRSGLVRLDGPVKIQEANQRVDAGSAEVQLDAQNRVVGCTLEDGVLGSMDSPTGTLQGRAQSAHADFDPGNGQVRAITAKGEVQVASSRNGQQMHLAAQQVNVTFQGRPARPQGGNASGDVQLVEEKARVEMAGAAATGTPHAKHPLGEEDLHAAAVQFEFMPGAWTLKKAVTVGQGKLVVTPENPGVGQRIITAEPLEIVFDAHNHPRTLRGLSQAHIVFLPSPQAVKGVPAESSSERLEAHFEPAKGTLQTVEQTGKFRFRQGDNRASSARASYVAARDEMTLTGDPKVWDPETHARADRILVHLADEEAEGLGRVRATHLETNARGRSSQVPVNVVADRMLARRGSQYVQYTGHVRVWQGQDVLETSSIDVFKKQGRMESGSRVLTSFLQPASHLPRAAGARTPASGEAQPVTVRADHLEYFDAGRRADYQGNVQLDTENATLRSDRLQVYFTPSSAPGASEVERAVADGHVTVTQPGRHASGEHAEYLAGPGKIVVEGGPPVLYDAEKGYTTGRRLTFFLRDDTIFLDGGKESPTISKHRISP